MIKPYLEIDPFDTVTPFVYIFVRQDIPPVQQVIQAAHAAHEAGIMFGKVNKQISHFCIFGVKNENDLLDARNFSTSNKIKGFLFYEPDFEMGNSAFATEPIVGEKRKLFTVFRLLRMKKPLLF